MNEQILLGLLRERKFGELVAHWSAASPQARLQAGAGRLAIVSFAELGRLDDAEMVATTLLTQPKVDTATYLLAGRIALDRRQFQAAYSRFEAACQLEPGNLKTWIWWADAAILLKSPLAAIQAAEQLALARSNNADASIRYVNLLVLADQVDAALIEFERILSRWPQHDVAGPAYVEFVVREYPFEAATWIDATRWRPQAQTLTPQLVRALVALPAWYENDLTATEWRERLRSNLENLQRLANTASLSPDERAACLAASPFFLTSHDADITDLQCAWGDFVEALVSPLRSTFRSQQQPSEQSRRRVGIVSNRLTNSSAGRFFNGWVHQLLQAGYDIRVYAIGATDDVTTDICAAASKATFVKDDVSEWHRLATDLAGDANDVLIFPEPQGSPLIQLVAAIRFAPVQCAGYGNPVTTGLPSIDYFLSASAAEPPFAQKFYRERLILLRGLGTELTFAAGERQTNRDAWQLADSDRVYLVTQQLQKWSPSFVDCLTQILVTDTRAVLIYFAVGGAVSTRAFSLLLRGRLQRYGVNVDRVRCMPPLSRERFLDLHAVVDVALDSFPFSGGSTTADASAMNLPIVSLQGSYLRGRLSSAILRHRGKHDGLVSTRRAFVQTALTIKRETAAVDGLSRVGQPEAVPHQPNLPEALAFDNIASFLKSLS